MIQDMSDQQTPENSPSAEAEPNPATDTPQEPNFGPGSAHFKQLAELEKSRRAEAERSKSLETKYKQMEELVRLAASDYDRFSAVMGKPKEAPQKNAPNPAEVALREVETLKRAIEQREAEEAKRAEEAQLFEAKTKISEYVVSTADKYPLTVALGFEEAVADLVHQEFLNGRAISEDQAASEIEKKLAARKDKLAPLFAAAQEQAKAEQPVQKPVVRTLTQSIQSEAPTSSPTKLVFEHRDQRIESMVKALRNHLKT